MTRYALLILPSANREFEACELRTEDCAFLANISSLYALFEITADCSGQWTFPAWSTTTMI